MLMLKLQYFGHLMWRVDSLEKTLMLGGIGGRRRSGRQRMRWLDGITDSMDVSLSESGSWWWAGRPGMVRFMGSQRVGHDWATDLIWSDGYKNFYLHDSYFCVCVSYHAPGTLKIRFLEIKPEKVETFLRLWLTEISVFQPSPQLASPKWSFKSSVSLGLQ